MSNAPGDFIWYELMTGDADAAQKFYADIIGWSAVPFGGGEVDYRVLMAGAAGVGGILQITDEMKAHGARPVWAGYIGVADVDATAASVAKAGGKVLMPPKDLPGVGRVAMVTDPQGAPFYIMRGASAAPSTAFSTKKLGHCAWNELSTDDQTAALDFYTSQFGWTAGEAMPMGEMGNYQILHQDEEMIGGMMKCMQKEMPSMWNYYFRVADISIAVDKVKAGGGTVVHGPQEIPGGERIILGIDPQGAMFALIGA